MEVSEIPDTKDNRDDTKSNLTPIHATNNDDETNNNVQDANYQEENAAAVYAVRVIHRNKSNNKSNSSSSQEGILFREEHDFLKLATALHRELPELDLDFSVLDNLLPDDDSHALNRRKDTVDNYEEKSRHNDIGSNVPNSSAAKGELEVDFMHIPRVKRLELFLESLLSKQDVVGSKAMAEFFASTAQESEMEDAIGVDNATNVERNKYSSPRIDGIHQYFFEDDIGEAVQIDLNRKGTASSAYLYREPKNIPEEGYFLWQFSVEQGFGIGPIQPIQFRIFKDDNNHLEDSISDVCVENDVNIDNLQVIREQDVVWGVRSDGNFVEGCFQMRQQQGMSENLSMRNQQVCLYFVNNNLIRQATILLKTEIVPKQVYEAASLAIEEQNELDKRRGKAPLLKEVLQSTVKSDPISVVVDLLKTASPNMTEGSDLEVNQQSLTIDKLKQNVDREILGRLKAEKKVSYLTKEIQSLRTDLSQAAAEKRVFTLSRKTIQDEVTAISKSLKKEKMAHAKNKEDFKTLLNENALQKAEIKALKAQILKQREIDILKSEMSSTKLEKEMALVKVSELEDQIEKIEEQKEELSAAIREEKSKVNEASLNARAEIEEARMMQRILEGKVRELEKKLLDNPKDSQNRRDSPSKTLRRKKHSGPLDPKREQKLKEQLDSLKARHSKLSELMKVGQDNEKNAELIQRIEEAIQEIVAATSRRL